MNFPTSDPRPTGFIKNRYGSRKGFLRFCYYEVLRLCGIFSSLKQIDFNQVERLVFVCQGNICRSPFGEFVARGQGVSAISFGLSTRGGDQADPRAIECARRYGVDLAKHCTQRVDQYQPQQGDLLVAMEPVHIRRLHELFSGTPVQITLAGLWLEESPFAYLHDPYNANGFYFERCEHQVYDSAQALVSRLSKARAVNTNVRY